MKMMGKTSIEALIREIPKAELHLHIEGTLEPEMMMEIARRNNAKPRYGSVEEARGAYNFRNLQDFFGGSTMKE